MTKDGVPVPVAVKNMLCKVTGSHTKQPQGNVGRSEKSTSPIRESDEDGSLKPAVSSLDPNIPQEVVLPPVNKLPQVKGSGGIHRANTIVEELRPSKFPSDRCYRAFNSPDLLSKAGDVPEARCGDFSRWLKQQMETLTKDIRWWHDNVQLNEGKVRSFLDEDALHGGITYSYNPLEDIPGTTIAVHEVGLYKMGEYKASREVVCTKNLDPKERGSKSMRGYFRLKLTH